MKTFTSIFALLAMSTITIASPVPEAEAGTLFEKRADQYFTFWTEVDFKGTKSTIKNPAGGHCYNLADPFQDTISSAGPTQGLTCTLWQNYNCGGAFVTLSYPAQSRRQSSCCCAKQEAAYSNAVGVMIDRIGRLTEAQAYTRSGSDPGEQVADCEGCWPPFNGEFADTAEMR